MNLDNFGAKRMLYINYIRKQSFYYEIVIVKMIFRNYFASQWLSQCNARHVDETKAVSMNFQLEKISCQSHNKTYNREKYQSRINIKCTFHFWYFKLFQYLKKETGMEMEMKMEVDCKTTSMLKSNKRNLSKSNAINLQWKWEAFLSFNYSYCPQHYSVFHQSWNWNEKEIPQQPKMDINNIPFN